jgi:hypothetical protein
MVGGLTGFCDKRKEADCDRSLRNPYKLVGKPFMSLKAFKTEGSGRFIVFVSQYDFLPP